MIGEMRLGNWGIGKFAEADFMKMGMLNAGCCTLEGVMGSGAKQPDSGLFPKL
jgi:hypothetical protein